MVESDRRQAIAMAIREARAGDTVLVAGKGHENYQLVGDKVLAFDDLRVAQEWLDRLAAAGTAA
jgi:UDP-N-acetylmuramoyl-L-alanyl-D-glutamate--2,6-diaminopimelate ligase